MVSSKKTPQEAAKTFVMIFAKQNIYLIFASNFISKT